MVILGIGNPGRKYAFTRHNAGVMAVKEFLNRTEKIKQFWSRSFRAWETKFENQSIIIVRSSVFMNESGKAALAVCSRFKIKPEELFVVYDDVNLPLGRLRIKRKGSSGGHKGIQSIIQSLNTEEFPRLKIGIGMPADNKDLVDYVLSEFSEEEKEIAEEMIKRAADAIEIVLKEGIEKAMAKVNGQNN